ncbi:hypothetical protein M569_02250 [Genlisea aurea]|uniref:UBC core domain-containing protein n=1 Tax=Genlisea aurea TaxID=192259 RepID=S8E9G8_9LAMI|nr:hypothetical protein M569_02250 [Genlisea aurea]
MMVLPIKIPAAGTGVERKGFRDNNILYPKEEKDQKILLYACRNCDHQEVAENNCVYRNEIHHSVGERTQVLQDVAADPTLPRTKSVRCSACGHGEAVFFQATARGEEGMTLFFVCCNPNFFQLSPQFSCLLPRREREGGILEEVLMMDKFNRRNPSVLRIMQEIKEMQTNSSDDFMCLPLEDDIFEWQFAIMGPRDTEFEGGIYHGRIQLPVEYPLKPPSFMLLTPSGRFETQTKICLSISNHHPEHWQPSWSVRTALVALIAFMPTPPNGALGSLDYTKEERKALAIKSREIVPKYGSPERQKLIDEIHEYMLSKTLTVPQGDQESEVQASGEVDNNVQLNPSEDIAEENAENIPPAEEEDEINEEASEINSTPNVSHASTSASEQQNLLIKPVTRASPKQADDRILTWAALVLSIAIVVLLLKKFLNANGHSGVFLDES